MGTIEADYPPTGRTRVKRPHERARYDRDAVHAILDAGLLCHLGYVLDGLPYVTPTAYRSAERRVGKECVRQCRSRWSPSHTKTQPIHHTQTQLNFCTTNSNN